MFVLPEPVGPGDQHHAVGLEDRVLELRAATPASKPSFVMSSMSLSLSSKPHDDLLAEQRRQHRDAEVELLVLASSLILILMRPSCGSRFSEMSSFAMIFMRDVIASSSFSGGFMIS